MQAVGIGRIIFWPGGSLWIGKAFAPSELHAHHAVQISFALSGRLQFRENDEEPWSQYHAVLIPPDLPHTFQAPGQRIAHLFCGPETAVGRGLLKHLGGRGITPIGEAEANRHAQALRQAYEQAAPDEDLEHLALETLFTLSRQAHEPPADRRVTDAISFMASHLAEIVTLEDVARHAGLSPSRFRHVFAAETGIPFRVYLLWTRLNRALELGFSGMSWTDAAHAANFADSAHLSRTMRRMFGFAPSAMLQEMPASSRAISA
jgi:AraC family transcriptional regulator